MKHQRVLTIARTTMEGTTLISLLLTLSTAPALAAGLTIDPTTSASTSGDWLEVIVGFGMLLIIGLGGLWFTQHQMKFR